MYVTQLFGEVIDPARPDGFDDAKQGVVSSFRVGDAITNAGTGAAVTRLLLKPMLSGFNADRRNFCPLTRDALQTAGTVKYFNSGPDGTRQRRRRAREDDVLPGCRVGEHRCGGPDRPASRRRLYPNMLFGALLRGPFLYVPNVGAQPEPPVNFNTNVQALVGVLSPVTNAETPFSVNLNTYVPQGADSRGADRVARQTVPQRHRRHRRGSPRQGLPRREPRRQLRDPRLHRHRRQAHHARRQQHGAPLPDRQPAERRGDGAIRLARLRQQRAQHVHVGAESRPTTP